MERTLRQLERTLGGEWWLTMLLMVDPQGNPYEMVVLDGSSALKDVMGPVEKAIAGVQFKPGTLNGGAVHASIPFNLYSSDGKGADKDFIEAYKEFSSAFAQRNRTAADSAMARMRANNLYEEAYVSLAQFKYASIWGTSEEALARVRRALATPKNTEYLTKDIFSSALIAKFLLEVDTQDYASAVDTWQRLRTTDLDQSVLAALGPQVEAIKALKSSSGSYTVPGRIDDSSWHYALFKRNFRIRVSEGQVTELKLRCERDFLRFSFDPSVEYQLPEEAGSCRLQVIGQPGARFALSQS